MMQVEVPTTLTMSSVRAARADRVPMRVEGAHRNRDAGLQSQLFRPMSRELPSNLIGSRVLAIQFFANAGEQRIDLDQELLRRQAAERRIPHPLVAHRADAALHFLRIGDAAQRRGDHVAVFERRSELLPLYRDCAAASAAASRIPTPTNTRRRTIRSLPALRDALLR